MWTCPKCRERVEGSFEVCWNCGTARDGSEDPSFRRAEQVEAEELQEAKPLPPENLERAKPLPSDDRTSTPAARPLVCSRCGSADVVPGIDLWARGADPPADLAVVVYEFPDALLLKGAHPATLRAWVCGRCGYAELYATNPRELFEAYRRSRRG